jgi:hypothetical protein
MLRRETLAEILSDMNGASHGYASFKALLSARIPV